MLRGNATRNNVFLNNYEDPDGVSLAEDVGYGCIGCDEDLGRANNQFRGNAILNAWWNPNLNHWLRLYAALDRDLIPIAY